MSTRRPYLDTARLPVQDLIMVEEPENIVLHQLRRLEAKLDRVQATLDDHAGRLQRLERRMVRANDLEGDLVRVDQRLDELDRRLDRIARCVEPA